ncbi:MAG: hypothetical protein ACJA2C_000113 [Marinoscillum sp.]
MEFVDFPEKGSFKSIVLAIDRAYSNGTRYFWLRSIFFGSSVSLQLDKEIKIRSNRKFVIENLLFHRSFDW